MNLTRLAGNAPLKRQLELETARRGLSHAYILSGPAGSGKRTLAGLLAAALVCDRRGGALPCLSCAGCRKAEGGIHPDIVRVGDDGKDISVAQVRALRADAYIRPNEAPKKVYILEHAELLGVAGQNILLKLIEEGPAYACFLFLAPQPEALLPTIRSRCETLYAPGPEEAQASEQGDELARLILAGAPAQERLPFLVSLEKREREELRLILETAAARLIAALPQRPDLLPVLDRLVPIRAACEYNISPGHLCGWLAAAL